MWPLTRAIQDSLQLPHSHDRALSHVLYNNQMNQVVSVCLEPVLKVCANVFFLVHKLPYLCQMALPHVRCFFQRTPLPKCGPRTPQSWREILRKNACKPRPIVKFSCKSKYFGYITKTSKLLDGTSNCVRHLTGRCPSQEK